MLRSLVGWLRTLDLKEVVYALLATFVAVATTAWLGGVKRVKRFVLSRRAFASYKKALRQTCQSLIVIGRRQGFSLGDVYVDLDLATSDLCPSPATTAPDISFSPWLKTCVIVAGPGAGKSTIVKHHVLEHLDLKAGLPFYIRLREYTPEKSIDEYLVEQLRLHGVPEPEISVRVSLSQAASLCVLDGLDEVRPNNTQAVCDRINSFFHKFFSQARGTLIVTCRKEAYRGVPLDIPTILEVRPLTDQQIERFARKWPLPYPVGKSAETFLRDLFASTKIQELARSPLLLVGGLMQYTESNLGIPEERVQYLARVGRWLVADWAVAQDHPPDRYRTLYPRVLARLALHMHGAGRSEYPIEEARGFIEQLLPEYGHESSEGSDVLSGLMTKTGI